MMKKTLLVVLLAVCCLSVGAQVGEHRSDFSVGVNGGYLWSRVNFVPSVSQAQRGAFTGGLSFRYVCEKYFKSICSLYGEVNFAQLGWKEDIRDLNDQRVVNTTTGQPEEFSYAINYVQVPLMARLAWGHERSGVNFFFQAGPQMGFCLSERSKTNFDVRKLDGGSPEPGNTLPAPNMDDRVNQVVAQDTMKVEHHFDYGIAAGIGVEFSHRKAGHFILEGRYYYGLGNIYGDSKLDYFGRSNFSNIVIKLTYLFDLARTKNDKIR